MLDLAAIFGEDTIDRPVAAGSGLGPPRAQPNAPGDPTPEDPARSAAAEPDARGGRMATEANPASAATDRVALSPAADASRQPPPGLDFSGWVQRSDARGRLGWEPPDLPEAARWWTRWDFNDLPGLILPNYLGSPGRSAAQRPRPCDPT